MNEYLNRYRKFLSDLKNLDIEIEDEDTLLLLLNSLPEKYDHLTTTLLYGKDEIKFAYVSSALINNEYKKLDVEIQRDRYEALNVRVENHKSKNNSLDKRKNLVRDKCSYRHERAHCKSECHMLEDTNIAEDRDCLNGFFC